SVFVLPARFADTRDQAVARQIAEADPADAELAVHGPRPAAHLAAVLDADERPRLEHLVYVPLGRVGLLQLALVDLHRLELLLVPCYFRVGRHKSPGPKSYAVASRNGMPNWRSSSRASSSLRVVVTIVTSIPCVKVTLSGSISGKTTCSERPNV